MLRATIEWMLRTKGFQRRSGIIKRLMNLNDMKPVRSTYGPIMRVRSGDATNFYCISGTDPDYVEVRDEIIRLRPGMAFLDIGANAGLFSMLASPLVGDGGVVLAFEPSTQIYGDLVANAHLNKLTNFFPFPIAVGDRTVAARFSSGQSNHTGIGHLDAVGDTTVLQVGSEQLTPIVEALVADRKIMAKIDVEGAECLVFDGLRELFSKPNIERVIVEVDDRFLKRFGNTAKDLYQRFEAIGFSPAGEIGRRDHYNEVFVRR